MPRVCLRDAYLIMGGGAISWSLTTVPDTYGAANGRHLHFENEGEVIQFLRRHARNALQALHPTASVRLAEAQTWRAVDAFMAAPTSKCNGDLRRWAISGTGL